MLAGTAGKSAEHCLFWAIRVGWISEFSSKSRGSWPDFLENPNMER